MLVRLLENNYHSFAKPFITCTHNVEKKVFMTQHTEDNSVELVCQIKLRSPGFCDKCLHMPSLLRRP